MHALRYAAKIRFPAVVLSVAKRRTYKEPVASDERVESFLTHLAEKTGRALDPQLPVAGVAVILSTQYHTRVTATTDIASLLTENFHKLGKNRIGWILFQPCEKRELEGLRERTLNATYQSGFAFDSRAAIDTMGGLTPQVSRAPLAAAIRAGDPALLPAPPERAYQSLLRTLLLPERLMWQRLLQLPGNDRILHTFALFLDRVIPFAGRLEFSGWQLECNLSDPLVFWQDFPYSEGHIYQKIDDQSFVTVAALFCGRHPVLTVGFYPAETHPVTGPVYYAHLAFNHNALAAEFGNESRALRRCREMFPTAHWYRRRRTAAAFTNELPGAEAFTAERTAERDRLLRKLFSEVRRVMLTAHADTARLCRLLAEVLFTNEAPGVECAVLPSPLNVSATIRTTVLLSEVPLLLEDPRLRLSLTLEALSLMCRPNRRHIRHNRLIAFHALQRAAAQHALIN